MDKKRMYREKMFFDDEFNRRRQDGRERNERPHHPHDDERRHRFEDDFKNFLHDRRPHFGPPLKKITKLIASKEELISYVNDLGEQGHQIDVFKIEDGLYKVVVVMKKRPPHDEEEDGVEVDID